MSRSLHRIVIGLNALGFEIEVACPRRTDRQDLVNTEPFSLHMLPGLPIPRYQGLRFGLPARRALIRRWREFQPDLIHVATEGPLGWSAVRAARHLGIPFITTFHTNFHQYGRHYGFSLFNRMILRWLLYIRRHAATTFVPSRGLLEELKSHGFVRLSILGRGVDTNLFHPDKRDPGLRAQWGAAPDTPVALYVGRVAGEKNIPLTIRAWKEMRTTLPNLKLVVVGDGPEKGRLEKAHPDIYFSGMRQGEDLARHYASGDFFPFASTTETFGNVITEAMASGLPVLTYNYAAGQDHIQHGKNGWVAPFDNSDAFLKTAKDLALNRHHWQTVGSAARLTAMTLSWDAIIERFASEIIPVTRPESSPLPSLKHSPSQYTA